MTFKPAKRVRQPAEPMKPIVDPAGWTAEELAASDDWIYQLSEPEIGELLDATRKESSSGRTLLDTAAGDFAMPRLDRSLAMLKDELKEGRGFVLIRGVPVTELSRAEAAMAFWAVGSRFGRALSQNAQGHVLGHVKDVGADPTKREVRGYLTHESLLYHCDLCDYVALFCLHPAKSGGESRIVSTVTVYNEMLKRYPDLLEALIGDFYFYRHNEISPGEEPFYVQPMFSFCQGYFSGRSPSDFAIKAQGVPGVPPFTEAQRGAFKAFAELAEELHFPMDFRQGDIQILHNQVMSHSRGAFEDWPEPDRRRHLFRLWLEDTDGRPMLPGVREVTHGVRVAGVPLAAPLDVEALV